MSSEKAATDDDVAGDQGLNGTSTDNERSDINPESHDCSVSISTYITWS